MPCSLSCYCCARRVCDLRRGTDEDVVCNSTGTIQDSLAMGVLEPAMSKCKSISFATEAAITILRIDDMIKIAAPEDPRGGY
eukprot:3935177-Rhodomonas_salina.3